MGLLDVVQFSPDDLIGNDSLIGGNEIISSFDPAFVIFLFMFIFLIIVGVYVYFSLAFMNIAKRVNKTKPTGIAWIPFLGPEIIKWHASGMHWWPWLLFIGMLIPILNLGFIITIVVFSYIWAWKTYKVMGRPGWWVLIPLIGGVIYIPGFALVGFSIAGISYIVSFILLGIVAWGEPSKKKK
ncbi:MAG: hypothetical protein KKF56_03845 [Nanoarchaeota archaeon]|nr:hypothetical protein [Nanoarchaeota archaeon]